MHSSLSPPSPLFSLLLSYSTGRPRRCGWLDIPVVQHAHMLSNFTSINITKLDIFAAIKEIKIGVAYKLDGKVLPAGVIPDTLEELAQVEVVYESFPGWMCDISKCKSFDELPVNARKYLLRIEELLGVPISWVGVGAGRLEMATRGFKEIQQ